MSSGSKTLAETSDQEISDFGDPVEVGLVEGNLAEGRKTLRAGGLPRRSPFDGAWDPSGYKKAYDRLASLYAGSDPIEMRFSPEVSFAGADLAACQFEEHGEEDAFGFGRKIQIRGLPEKEGVKAPVMRWQENTDEDQRGWVTCRLDALFETPEGEIEKAGDLKVTWIPERIYARLYPSVLNFLSVIKGELHYFDTTEEDYNRREKRVIEEGGADLLWAKRVVDVSKSAHTYRDWISETEALEMSGREREEIIREAEKKIEERFAERIERFKQFHVGRPYVRYSEVEKPYRRAGIATLLYRTAAMILARRFGFGLHASNGKTKAAEALWRSLEAREDVPTSVDDARKDLRLSVIKYT